MAKLIGLDIQNRHVRAVLLATSYRRVAVEAFTEVDRTEIPDLVQAVQAALVPVIAHSDGIAIAVDGDSAFLHRLEVPATAEKQLAEVIRFELEAQVPVDIDELVYDFTILPRRVAGGPIQVLVVAARTTHVKERLEIVARAASREPERVGVGALPLANLVAVVPELDAEGPVGVLELGVDRSEIVVLSRGHLLFARTLSIGISGLPASAPELAARLRQTLAAASLVVGAPVQVVYLTGVGATASGAEAYLAAEAGVPVTPLPAPRFDAIAPEHAESLPRFSRALGLALGLRSRPRDLDLRRGSLSYQRGFAFIKERAPVLAALGGTILLSFFFSTWAELRALAHEQEGLSAQLATLSTTVLGEEAENAERATELLDAARAKVETDPMPHADGFDVMIQLSKAVPTAIVHDVEELDLAREKVKIRGIVGSAGEAQQVADAMKQYSCMPDVKISKVTQVVNGSRQKYVLEGDLRCPQDVVAKKKPENEESEKRP